MTETTKEEALNQSLKPMRQDGAWFLNAYYYGFDKTGNPAIDAILQAVAAAGKGYHHTDGWTEPNSSGFTYAELIQHAANEAARKWGSEQ